MPANTVFQSTNLLQVWAYFARDVVKDYENNIKQHFAAYVQRFVNVVCNKKRDMASDEKATFTKRLQKIKTQILERNTSKLVINWSIERRYQQARWSENEHRRIHLGGL